MTDIKKRVVMGETTPEFRNGFEFCVRALVDCFENPPHGVKNIDAVGQLLADIFRLIHTDSFWPGIEKIAKRGDH